MKLNNPKQDSTTSTTNSAEIIVQLFCDQWWMSRAKVADESYILVVMGGESPVSRDGQQQ